MKQAAPTWHAGAHHAHAMPFGATVLPEGGVRFALWAPGADRVELALQADGEASPAVPSEFLAVERDANGWCVLDVPEAGAGTLYRWRIGGNLLVPDPASRFNPTGVHGPSAVVDPLAFTWDAGWKGRPWRDTVLYEMHVGTFTEAGTYAAAEEKLAALAAVGITAVELMPLADFPGRFGWGYDGVLHFAPHAPYGTPEELKHFIQAAHRLGLMVFLDVVYNHFGPDGNYLGAYAPQFFSTIHTNPWGMSLNFDGDASRPVRDFYVANALYWLNEYRFDGMRFDAIHAIVDDSAPDIMAEISAAVREHTAGRHVHLVLENERNVYNRLSEKPLPGSFDAQWNDDYHHVMHVVLTGESDGYYSDYGSQPVELLGRSLANGMLWEGSDRDPEGARLIREPAPPQPLGAMVNFLNNHDQSGNRAFGERMAHLVPHGALHLATAITLLAPSTPMLFFGEEFGATTPFLYFADWEEGELRQAVTEGRQREFAHIARAHGDDPDRIPPGPCEAATFEASRLDWDHARSPQSREWRYFVQRLLEERRAWVAPRLESLQHGRHSFQTFGKTGLRVRWRYGDGKTLELQANLGSDAVDASAGPAANAWQPLHDVQEIFRLNHDGSETVWSPWSGHWRMGSEG